MAILFRIRLEFDVAGEVDPVDGNDRLVAAAVTGIEPLAADVGVQRGGYMGDG